MMEESVVNTEPEIHLQLWPPKLSAKGRDAIRAVAAPLRMLLYTSAICRVLKILAWAGLAMAALL